MSPEVMRVRAQGTWSTHVDMAERLAAGDTAASSARSSDGSGGKAQRFTRTRGLRQEHKRSLFWRLSLVNVSVLVAVAILLAVTPVTISVPIRATELLIIVLGLLATTAVNLLLVRRTLAPLQRLTELMKSVDPMEPGRRLTDLSRQDADIAALADSFNSMLDRLEFERRESARRALNAQEQERLRIARELHDEVGQTLTAVALEAERAAEASSGSDRQSWLRVAEWGQQSVDEVRRIARELRPEALDDLGLINAFIALCNRVAAQAGIEIERRLPDRLPPHSPEIDLVVYRVAQESLTNVMRHAEASRAIVSLAARGDRLRLSVKDDGRGIAAGERGEAKTGLAGMRERAMLVGGSLTVSSDPGKGTEVELEVPLQS
jgi:two-component system, NarL family, sensor histidine kinase UhpB